VAEWTGAVDLSADELCGPTAAQVSRRPRERAAEFLREALAGGPRPVSELEKLAADRGMNWRTLERAKQAIGVVTEREKQGWSWRLPSLSNDGDALRSSTLRALIQLPKQIDKLHALRREGDKWDFEREEARESQSTFAPEG